MTFISILKITKNKGINIVSTTSIISTFIALFFNSFIFLFDITVTKYCNKFITLELNTLKILALASPLKLDTVIVSNSGTDVATPATFPIVFGFKFKLSASFLNVVTNTNFEITTIIAE